MAELVKNVKKRQVIVVERKVEVVREVRNKTPIVQFMAAGARGPKGDPGLTPEEVDQRIDERLEENKLVFRDIAGNIYENGD